MPQRLKADGGATTTPAPAARPARGAAAISLGAAWRVMRPAEWAKNGLVLAPAVLAGVADDLGALTSALGAFAAFCLAASAGYVVNDVLDADSDRLHPLKRTRPVAAGELGVRPALALAAGLGSAALSLAALVGLDVAAVVAGYLALSVAYSELFRAIPLMDVVVIAGCFLLRALAGGVAVGVALSGWLLLCVGLLALFLALTKRRQEARVRLADGRPPRSVLAHYPPELLDRAIAAVTAVAVGAYVVYATRSPIVGAGMLATVPAVLLGVGRYLHLVYRRRDPRDAVTLLLTDRVMQLAVLAWAGSTVAALYLFGPA